MTSKLNRPNNAFMLMAKLINNRVFKKKLLGLISIVCFILSSFDVRAEGNEVVIQNFESRKSFKSRTIGLYRVKHKNPDAKKGKYGASWDVTSQSTATLFSSSHDWSGSNNIQFLVHSEKANSQRVRISFFSHNIDTDGDDYFEYTFYTDWVGWKKFILPFSSLSTVRQPLGFQKIEEISIRAYPPKKGNGQKLILDDWSLTNDFILQNIAAND